MTRLRVLAVDDDPDVADLLALLVLRAGHIVETIANGELAAERYAALGADVVLTDWRMPGQVGGRELVSRIRARPHPAYPYTYLVVVSGGDEAQVVLEALRAGADDYLTKPITPDALEARLLVAERVVGLHAERMGHLRELERLNRELLDLVELHAEAEAARTARHHPG